MTDDTKKAEQQLVDKELHYIEETISALKKIEDTDCTEDVWETIQAAIEDLEQCV